MVSTESAVLVEPTAVVMQGLLKANPGSTAKVLVIGDGTIGLIAATLVRNWVTSGGVHLAGLKSEQNILVNQTKADKFIVDDFDPTEKYDLVFQNDAAPFSVDTLDMTAKVMQEIK